MSWPSLQDPAWYQASTLKERLASLPDNQSITNQPADDFATGQRRLERWRSQPPFTTGALFSQRLALDGITEPDLLYLLAEPAASLQARLAPPPPWLEEIASAYAAARASENDAPPSAPDGQQTDFLKLVEPLIERSLIRLRAGIQGLSRGRTDLPFNPETIEEIFLVPLRVQVLQQLGRTLVLELNVARLDGSLRGATPGEQFQSFIVNLSRRETALRLLREYPVLARQLVLLLQHWLDSSLEFLSRLLEDWPELCRLLSPQARPGPLCDLQCAVGDRHRRGRAVMAATFEGGLRLLYKPRSLGADVRVQRLLKWLNERGAEPQFYRLRLIERSGYGWSEYAEAGECQTEEQAERFYRRQGGYLALLYLLGATDFRQENLIAAGEHPVLLDAESLFRPRLGGAPRVDAPADAILESSVLRVGLLPRRIRLSHDGRSPDVSRPDALVEGFTDIYRLLLRRRDELLADDGPLAAFADDEVRIIIRPTKTYGLLLHESFHPDVLRNALDRDRFFDRLWNGVEAQPFLSRVIHAEIDDLQQGDIPYFTTRPDSVDIRTSAGERIPNFLDESGLSLARRRVCDLSEQDLKRQQWIIRTSLASSTGVEEQRRPHSNSSDTNHPSVTRAEMMAIARAIGDRLEELALADGTDVSWLGLNFIDEETCSLLPLSHDLYNGLAGVALYLAYLGQLTREPRYGDLARAACDSLRAYVSPANRERDSSRFHSVGVFDGSGSFIYSLTHLARLWQRTDLLDTAESLLEALPPLIERDQRFDLISGSAGLILALLALHQCRPSATTMQLAVCCGEHLLAHAQAQDGGGIGWKNQPSGGPPLTGFSHGNAGIALALWRLGRLTRRSEFTEASEAALTYERRLYCARTGNWPDLRQRSEEGARPGGSMAAWCHGATGIGLSRLLMLREAEGARQAALRREVEVSVETTLREGFGHNHSLCHGDLGNLELVIEAARLLGERSWEQAAQRQLERIVRSINQEGWRCAVPLRVETPGLMTGLAGIGYGMLRMAEPRRVASVLSLSIPESSAVSG